MSGGQEIIIIINLWSDLCAPQGVLGWVGLVVGGISHSEFALDAPISITLSVCSVSQSEVGTQSGTVCADGMPLYPNNATMVLLSIFVYNIIGNSRANCWGE